jgi:hypothetical protein
MYLLEGFPLQGIQQEGILPPQAAGSRGSRSLEAIPLAGDYFLGAVRQACDTILSFWRFRVTEGS